MSPGEGNIAEDGSAVDEFGQINGVMYKCPVKGCWLQKKTGERGKVCYKVYAIHMASQHRHTGDPDGSEASGTGEEWYCQVQV